MANTANFNIPKPDPEADVDEEFYRLQAAWDLIDSILQSLTFGLTGKAPLFHGHQISDVAGLSAALEQKLGVGEAFNLDDLGDVDGADNAAVGYMLVKAANGKWQPLSPIAALGPHQHAPGDIVGLAQLISAAVS